MAERPPVPLAARVCARLADGRFHSGQTLAQELGVSRSAVWKTVMSLRGLGVALHAVRNRGYRLALPAEPLDTERIRAGWSAGTRKRVRRLEVEWSLPSTNAALLARADLPCGQADVLLAEYQSAGRGRRGRAWLAPPGAAICLSVSWSFPRVARDMGALGLVVGVCALRALRGLGAHDIGLKWPNDLLAGAEGKLAGILVEMRAEAAGPAYVVAGIGVNVALDEKLRQQVAATGTQASDLRAAGCAGVGRNAVVAALVEAMLAGLRQFEGEGLGMFLDEWRRADVLRGRVISVRGVERTVRGIARGVDVSGALLVETPQGLERFVSGDVSVRPEA